TLAYFGIANLIESITVRKNSKDVIFYADGRQLALISATRKLHPAVSTQLTATGNNQVMSLGFYLPFNVLENNYAFLQDATSASDLTLTVKWRDITKIYSAGGADLTYAGNAVSLDVETVAIAGGTPGKPGGQGYPYPTRIIDVRTVKITATQSDLAVDLNKQSAYNRFIITCLTASEAPSEAILNKATLQIGTTVLRASKAAVLRDEMNERYHFITGEATGSAAMTLGNPCYIGGSYIFDVPSEIQRINEIQAVADPTLTFQLILDVTQLNAADKILLVSDRIVAPSNVA
ncbi:MAG: hypothetical protein IT442_16660, partial [Phycisphaeraceae bacterium]|nr:hypothetical protein [Phycisphaeraceae bacterium]